MHDGPLSHLRICDLSGQLAGAGATKVLAAFGAQVIRVEDPVARGLWDILRATGPYRDDRRDVDRSGGFNNHNVEKLGVTINLRDERGRELLRRLIVCSDVLCENFSTGVLDRLGFSYGEVRALRPDIVYASSSGFGHSGPYRDFKTWGPIVQAVSGLTFEVGLPGHEPAGWGYSLMDHVGASALASAILAALIHRERTGEGQRIDLACTEVALSLLGPAVLDVTANERPRRRDGSPDSNRSEFIGMAPHGVFRAAGDDAWVALACRHDGDWRALAELIGEPWAGDARWRSVEGRRRDEDELHRHLAGWTAERDAADVARSIRNVGVPASVVVRPEARIEHDGATREFGLWPEVEHPDIGSIRVDGLPFHLSDGDWSITQPAPRLGEHNDVVFGEVLGLSGEELDELRAAGVI
jgi:crotonobetainyl-CoA:carnitine CoA-transferase CaiB-like acyl-CoA transferase